MATGDISYTIEGLQAAIDSLQATNDAVLKSKNEFAEYVTGSLEPKWTSEGGKAAVGHLKTFVNDDFQQYVNYLITLTDDFENIILPKLKQLDLV